MIFLVAICAIGISLMVIAFVVNVRAMHEDERKVALEEKHRQHDRAMLEQLKNR